MAPGRGKRPPGRAADLSENERRRLGQGRAVTLSLHRRPAHRDAGLHAHDRADADRPIPGTGGVAQAFRRDRLCMS